MAAYRNDEGDFYLCYGNSLSQVAEELEISADGDRWWKMRMRG